MKKLFVLLAILSFSGIAFGASIPSVVSPADGPEVWTVEVYNDSGSALTSGSIVVWDYTDTDMSSIANRKMYVTTTTTVDDVACAGIVVSPSIAAGDVGAIAIYGPVPCRVTGTVTAGLGLATSATAGVVGPYSNTSNDDAAVGMSVAATTSSNLGGGGDIGIVFVNPSLQLD